MKKRSIAFWMVFFVLSWLGQCLAADQPRDELQVSGPPQAAKLSFEPVADNKVVVAVQDTEGNAIPDLGVNDFKIWKGPKIAEIISVENLLETKDVPLNLVLVVDNSKSMMHRFAVEPLLAALRNFLTIVRPVDNVHAVVFVDAFGKPRTQAKPLSTKVFSSNDTTQLNRFFKGSLDEGLTEGTYLYDAMAAGLDILATMPAKSKKYMVVFSDGEDINSVIHSADVTARTGRVQNLTAFAVDFMDKPTVDPYLSYFAEGNNGVIRKARSASDLGPIFKSFSTMISQRYIVTYRFRNPPTGTLAIAPAVLKIEDVEMVDSSPLLPYIYFETGEGRISTRYVTLTGPEQTKAFSVDRLKDTMEKHHQLLNVIGSRLVEHPDARITLTGCNSGAGEEKGNIALSHARSAAVAAYLENIWGISADRIRVEARNLPTVPSTDRVPEGRVENQRVEVASDEPAILDTVNSVYQTKVADANRIALHPAIMSETAIQGWQVKLLGDGKVLKTMEDIGEIPGELVFELDSFKIDEIAQMKTITAQVEVTDKEKNTAVMQTSTPLKVNLIRRQERIAQKLGQKVIEKYGLILFEFDRAEIKDRNRVVIGRIIGRINELGSAQPRVQIVGHTDIIGTEEYNLKLSERRAAAANDMVLTGGIPFGANVGRLGVGPREPLYDNSLPEGRALNRTVLITIEYEKQEAAASDQ